MKIKNAFYLIMAIVISLILSLSAFFISYDVYTATLNRVITEKSFLEASFDDFSHDLSQGNSSLFKKKVSDFLFQKRIPIATFKSFISDEHSNIEPRYALNPNFRVDNLNCISTNEISILSVLTHNCFRNKIVEFFDDDKKNEMYSLEWNTIINDQGILIWSKVKRTGTLLIFIFCLVTVIQFWLSKSIIRPLAYIRKKVSKNEIAEMQNLKFRNAPVEIKLLFESLKELDKEVSFLSRELINKTKLETKMQLASQVAHDIRSPLAALNVVADEFKLLPNETRELTANAIGRIQKIANDLLKENLMKESYTLNLVSETLKSIVNEKQVEYSAKALLSISLLDRTNKKGFISLDPIVYSRVVSNIINNAAEALEFNGSLKVELREKEVESIIVISDNGPGFPSQIMEKPLERGKTLSKKGGQGLGLYHAYETVKKAGGDLELQNDNGAVVTITLPKESTPLWFCTDINLKQKLVVCDDDKSIHNLWGNVLRKNNIDPKDVIHVYDANELAEVQNINDYLILMDYDLRSKETGLELTKRFTLKNVVFVTSEYERDDLQKYCIENNLKILPKSLIESLIP